MFNKLSALIRITLFWVLIGCELLLARQLFILDLLPTRYLKIGFVFLGIAALFLALLLFLPKRKSSKRKNRISIRRIIACILTVTMSTACGMGVYALSKLNTTIDSVIDEDTVISDIIGIYVLSENSAKELSDTSDYKFAVTESYDWENTQKTLEEITKKLGAEPKTTKYDHVFAMLDALYNAEADAVILNTAYVSILEEIEGYSDFENKTRLVYEFSIEETIIMDSEDTTKPESTPEPDDSTPDNPDDPAPTKEPTKEPIKEPTKPKTNAFVVYISGSDTRSTTLKTSRSDVNILAVVNPDTKQILLVNTPRDYYIANPAGGGALDKLTHCGIYGINCSMKALANLYNVYVDYYAQVNFTGFEKLVDAVGGVTIYSEKSFQSTNDPNLYIKKGNNTLNGHQAVSYARERYAFTDGDNARGRNQMKLINAIVKKLTSGTIITRYADIMDSMKGTFKTNMPMDKISELAKMQLETMSSWDITNYAVTGYDSTGTTFSSPNHVAYVMKPNKSTVNQASSLINKVLAGEKIS